MIEHLKEHPRDWIEPQELADYMASAGKPVNVRTIQRLIVKGGIAPVTRIGRKILIPKWVAQEFVGSTGPDEK